MAHHDTVIKRWACPMTECKHDKEGINRRPGMHLGHEFQGYPPIPDCFVLIPEVSRHGRVYCRP